MTPFWTDDHLTLYGGDCRSVLAELPAESVHCVVTSPPYWGLRDYGTATWDGGDPACDHERARKAIGNSPSAKSTLTTNNGRGPQPGDKFSAGSQFGYAHVCPCGAVRMDSQLGLEPTPEEYVANMVAVFREVRRVLRADGTLWLNLGDSYASDIKGSGGTAVSATLSERKSADGAARSLARQGGFVHRVQHGLKPKDLVGIPWRVAFALQADGWYLRSDIIWSKPNPMPESVTDRPTKAHEYLFLLSKSSRYYYDADAVREEATGRGGVRYGVGRADGPSFSAAPKVYETGAGGRNLRSVWQIATEPYPGAHFATFPRKLVEPCVKAGTSERGVCSECGAPWVRVVERERPGAVVREVVGDKPRNIGQQQDRPGRTYEAGRGSHKPDVVVTTTGWRSVCAHTGEPVPATVLDPFAGSGTTLLVAQALGRRGVGIDLNPEYLKQALVRNAQTPLGLVG